MIGARQCTTREGIPKLAYRSFDAAHDAAMQIGAQQPRSRVHAYRCPEHGWHIGHNANSSPPSNARQEDADARQL